MVKTLPVDLATTPSCNESKYGNIASPLVLKYQKSEYNKIDDGKKKRDLIVWLIFPLSL